MNGKTLFSRWGFKKWHGLCNGREAQPNEIYGRQFLTALAQKLAARDMDREKVLVTSTNLSMQRVLKLARGVAMAPVTVLLTGESGTGKEVFARFIHNRSERVTMPYVAVNCGAVVSSLAESELFGHEKGAFSGATERRIGCFEAANRGTILLDEISEMSYSLQTKLLRVLQEREIHRVGSNHAIPVDVRIIATSNRNLRQMVADGEFREDLYYRLNVFPLHIPPLRERLEDIPELAEVIMKRVSYRFGQRRVQVSMAALDRLFRYTYQGNVRELQNILERALVLCDGQSIQSDDIIFDDSDELSLWQEDSSDKVGSLGDVLANGSTLADIERKVILQVLGEADGNRTHASRTLGISIRTLRNRLREYRDQGLPVPEPGFGRQMIGAGL
jgi:two-component system response regulator FlrC